MAENCLMLRFSFAFAFLVYLVKPKFIIERNGAAESDSRDVFTNPGGCYRNQVCTSLGAKCYAEPSSSSNTTYHCCKCECKKARPYFYSLFTGCLNSEDILYGKNAHAKHETCLFTLKSSRIHAINTFTKSDDMMTRLRYNNTGNKSLLLTNPDIWCFPRRVYFFTRYGKERLAFENSCTEIIGIKTKRSQSNGSIAQYLKFESRNSSDWKLQEGKLLKVEIICKNLRKNLTLEASSCLIFRVNGSYNDEDPFVSHHSPKLCPPAPSYIPPPATPGPPKVKPWRKFALAIGLSVTASVLLISLAAVAVVCFLKRQQSEEITESGQAESTANTPFLEEQQNSTQKDDVLPTDENTNETTVKTADEDEKAELEVKLVPKTTSEKEMHETECT